MDPKNRLRNLYVGKKKLRVPRRQDKRQYLSVERLILTQSNCTKPKATVRLPKQFLEVINSIIELVSLHQHLRGFPKETRGQQPRERGTGDLLRAHYALTQYHRAQVVAWNTSVMINRKT